MSVSRQGAFFVGGKILIVDDVATNRIVLKVKLASAYYDTIQAATSTDALRLAQTELPDLILLAQALPDMSGVDLCRRLKAQTATADIPVVMISAVNEQTERLQGLRAGAADVYAKPLDELVLLARIRSLLRARETQEQLGLRDNTCRELGLSEPPAVFSRPGLIGLVARQVEVALHWKRQLQPHLHDRLLVLDRDAALGEQDGAEVPDVFLVAGDIGRPGDGLRFLSELRSRPVTRHAGLCLVLPTDARENAATALDLGAGDVICDNADPEEMALRLSAELRAKRQADRLRSTVADGLRLAVIDPLTGLYNRRYGLPHMALIADRAMAAGRSFAVLLVDIDRFKSVNDTCGHTAGDQVLVEVARRLQTSVRPSDMVARIGGEEFLIVLADCTFEIAHATAERLRRLVGDDPVRIGHGAGLRVTISIGLAMGDGVADAALKADDIVARADHALLAAKAEGRNQVTVHRSAA